jgi:hypothetical protein
MDRYPGTQLFYPYDAPELKDGHRYGWQIQKIKNNILVDKSEAWEFILPLEVIPTPQYHKLKTKSDGTIAATHNEKLYFEYDERYQNDALKFFVYDPSNELIQTISPELPSKDLSEENGQTQLHHTGANYYEMDLSGFAEPGIYRLVTINGKKQRYELKFEVPR